MLLRRATILIIGILGIGLLLLFSGQAVFGQPTIPTRTPTPDAPPPTEPPDNGGDNPPPTAVPSTGEPTATATESAAVTIAATPAGGFLPTAVPCDANPTVLANGTVNVRSGPGTDYEVISQLVFLEVRFINGRAADVAWWQIELFDGSKGWVADETVTTHGYLGVVPVVPAPALASGATPTAGTPWQPQLDANCDALPTFTPAVTATAAATATGTPLPEDAATAETTATPPPATETAVPPTDTPVPSNSATATVAAAADTATPAPQPTAAALEEPAAGSNLSSILPIAAVILVGAGIVVTIIRRRAGKA